MLIRRKKKRKYLPLQDVRLSASKSIAENCGFKNLHDKAFRANSLNLREFFKKNYCDSLEDGGKKGIKLKISEIPTLCDNKKNI